MGTAQNSLGGYNEADYSAVWDCDIFAFGTSSAERLRDLDLSMNKTL